MRFLIDDIPIYFPYPTIYPEQLKYIKEIIESIQSQGNICIQMPSGAGKTISLLSATISYHFYLKRQMKSNSSFLFEPLKIIYCSRTVPEIDKTLKELENLYKYIKENFYEENKDVDFLGLGLTSKKHLCVNDEVLLSKNVELECRNKISQWSRSRCSFYDNLKKLTLLNSDNSNNSNNFEDIEEIKNSLEIESGVFTFDKLKEYFKNKGFCPYFSVRKLLNLADCLIYTYNYLLDPNIYDIVCKKLSKNSVVIFDEAHNIDNSCIESFSIEIQKNNLMKANLGIRSIENIINNLIASKEKSYEVEIKNNKNYQNLRQNVLKEVEGVPYNLNKINSNNSDKINSDSSNLDKLKESITYIPGNIRNSHHFLSILKRLLEFFKTKLKSSHLTSESPNSFLKSIYEVVFIDKETLKFCSQRYSILLNQLEIDFDENLNSLKLLVDFVSLSSQFNDGFVIIMEPYDSFAKSLYNPKLKLACLDASIGFKTVLPFRNIIITSGTLSPIDFYPQILNFNVKKLIDIGTTLTRNSISPLIITKGNDQQMISNNLNENLSNNSKEENSNVDKMTTSFSVRTEPSNVRNYGQLVIEMSQIIPDGIVVFFPSYIYMEEILSIWDETKVLERISRNKLIFIETPSFKETDVALEAYKKTVDSGKGSILFCVARGKISEGVDFQNQYGRCVILIGIPFQYTESITLQKRLMYLKEVYNINESEFLTFDAMRHAAQCLGRVIRNKDDYGIMILADVRFNQKSKINKLPSWILSFVEEGHRGLSIDMAKSIAKSFFRSMAQKVSGKGYSILDEKDIEKFL